MVGDETQSAERTATSRRQFLQRGSGAAGLLMMGGSLSTLIAACGGSSSNSAATATAATGLTQAQVASATGNINVLVWSFYQNKPWKTGSVHPKFADITSEQAIIAKARQPGVFDLVDTSPNIMVEMFAIKRMVPINTALIKNYSTIDAAVRANDAFKGPDGQVYAVPFAFSDGLTAWNSKQVPEPKSVSDFLKPQYKGKIGLSDSSGTVALLAWGLLGVSDAGKITSDDLSKVQAFMSKLKPQVKTFYPFGGETNLLSRGDIAVAFQTYGSLVGSVQKKMPEIKTNHTGSNSYVDCFSIMKGADEATALNWINRVLSLPAQKAMAVGSLSYPVVDAARSALPPAYQKQSTSEILRVAPIQRSFLVEKQGDFVTIDDIERVWNDFKA